MGTSDNSSGVICVVNTRSIVSAARQQESYRVCQYANQWSFHTCPHHHLLWTHYYFPHCYWCSYIHWLALTNYKYCFFFSSYINCLQYYKYLLFGNFSIELVERLGFFFKSVMGDLLIWKKVHSIIIIIFFIYSTLVKFV